MLDDCRAALEDLSEASSKQSFRIRWVMLLALLRAVGHVLEKVDGTSNPAMRKLVQAKWEEWNVNRNMAMIFWEFIDAERNNVLKTYDVGYDSGSIGLVVEECCTAELFALDEAIFTPIVDGPYAGQDGRDVAREAIDWWECQLSAISASV